MHIHLPGYIFFSRRWAQLSQRRTIKQATLATYRGWAKRHPEWVVAFFDEHFVTQHAVPLLTEAIEGQRPLDPFALATQWADQFHFAAPRRRTLITALLPALADFLALFRAELTNQPRQSTRWLQLQPSRDQPCTDCN